VLNQGEKTEGLFLVAKDVSDRWQMEKQLQLIQTTVATVKECLFWIDEQAKFHFVNNSACERIFGYNREEAIGWHAKELILPPEVHAMVAGVYQNLMQRKRGQHSINENITKADRIIFCERFNTTQSDKDGKAIGVASICRSAMTSPNRSR